MHSEHLTPLTKVDGPYVSVFFDDSGDSAEASGALQTRWRDIHRDLQDSGAPEATVAAVEEAVLHGKPAVGRWGHGVIAAGDRVLVDARMPSPPPTTTVRVSDYPYFLPLLDSWQPPYVFAAIDHLGADITVHQDDRVHTETIEGEGFPVHKPHNAGWYGLRDLEGSAEEAVRMNIRAVADRLTALMDQSGAEVLFLAGEVQARAAALAALPDRIAGRVSQLPAGSTGRRADEAEADESIVAELDRHRDAAVEDTDMRFRAEIGRGSGLAAEGLAAVCAALRAGDVDTLIVGNLGDGTVLTGSERTVLAPDPDTLSELGQSPSAVVRVDEALPFVALAVGARVVHAADDIALADGIGALLRYPAPEPTDRPGGAPVSATR
ncbi:MAG TPA: hypothetical protein PKI77_19735 [Mycobacterium sp.]|nr:hypothetical protein [Mycobacterium sp.]